MVDANVNFGASKLTVYGKASIEAIEKAGAFENIKIVREKEEVVQEPFFKKYSGLIISFFLMVLGYLAVAMNGEGHMTSILAFAAAMIVGGARLFKAGLQNLTRFIFDMKTLMKIAIIGAAIIGEWSEGAVVVILFAISEALEKYSMDKARKSIQSLMEIAPKEAVVRRNGQEVTIPVDEIEIGDTMLVKPGMKIAMDGVVLSGASSINQAYITGESVPVEKGIDDEVFAGTLNGEGFLEVKVTKRAEDTTIAKIIHLVEEAQGERAPSQAFVDRFAKYYTPVIIVVAALVAIVPPLLWGANWNTWIYQGLAVLVVGCPCALVISTPVAIVTAIGTAARNGVLIKGGIYLEEMGAIKAIAFDKTGTLTKGIPTVTDVSFFLDENGPVAKELADGDEAGFSSEASRAEAFAPIAALEARSQHPLAAAIIEKAREIGATYEELSVEDFQSITGKGLKGKVDSTYFYIGNVGLFTDVVKVEVRDQVLTEMTRLQEQGKTVMLFGNEEKLLGMIAVADEVRASSRSAIQKIHHLGIRNTLMLTGDNEKTAQAIGRELGVTDIQANLLPEEKLKFIKRMGKEYGKVAMVGDGVNDAPALASATVGIAMGGAGTDTALETADIALMGDDLDKLAFMVKLSRRALAIIKQNITFAIGIKLVALLLVVPGWLTLWIAIFADMGATIIVTLNGLRLLKK